MPWNESVHLYVGLEGLQSLSLSWKEPSRLFIYIDGILHFGNVLDPFIGYV